MRARVMLLRNIMLQNLGRERDVPGFAVQALREAGAAGPSDPMSPEAMPCLQCTLLGVKALHKMGRPDGVPAFIAAASEAVPSLATEFGAIAGEQVACGNDLCVWHCDEVCRLPRTAAQPHALPAGWLHERIAQHPGGPQGAAGLLASRTFLSSVDLAAVAGAPCIDELCTDLGWVDSSDESGVDSGVGSSTSSGSTQDLM
jgi:hypothetical protein